MLDKICSVIVDLEDAISAAEDNKEYQLRLQKIQGMLIDLETDYINDNPELQ